MGYGNVPLLPCMTGHYSHENRLRTSSLPMPRRPLLNSSPSWRCDMLKYIFNETNIKPLFQDEILPATRLAHLQLPADPEKRWKTVIPVIAELKEKAKKLGLWNLFLSKAHYPE